MISESIIDLVFSYSIRPKYMLRSSISENDLEYEVLTKNPNALTFLEDNPELINWSDLCFFRTDAINLIESNLNMIKPYPWRLSYLCTNPSAIHIIRTGIFEMDKFLYSSLSRNPEAIDILENHTDMIDWRELSFNPSAIHILEKNIDKIDWKALSENHSAIPILEKNLDKVCWKRLSSNTEAIHILEKNIDKIDWYYLSKNPAAIRIIEKNLDKVDWDTLSENPAAIHILEKNLDRVNRYFISKNPAAIHILERNRHLINTQGLSLNPSIFVIDHERTRYKYNKMIWKMEIRN